MKSIIKLCTAVTLLSVFTPGIVQGEILAMMNYESKPADSLKALKLTGTRERKEGIAIVDVDPNSAAFGNILADIPLPNDLVAHHIFYDRKQEKAYVTALGRSELRVFKLNEFPYRLKRIDVPMCKMAEDVVFSEDNSTWYLTCMNSATVVVGDVASDKIKSSISLPNSYPHGMVVLSSIDRLLVSSTIRGDLKDPHDFITEVEASTGKELARYKLSNKPSPAGVAPVELLKVPGSNPPQVYVTNMFGAALWSATWNPAQKNFDVAQAFDLKPSESNVPLEIYVNKSAERMYVTTSNPGKFHIFDIAANKAKPRLLKTIPTARGAHHVAFNKDGQYAFVQNSFLNLPGMRDGSITVVDLQKNEVVRSMDTLKNNGLNPNCIVLLPQWNDPMGH